MTLYTLKLNKNCPSASKSLEWISFYQLVANVVFFFFPSFLFLSLFLVVAFI